MLQNEGYAQRVRKGMRKWFWKGLMQLGDPKIWTASLSPFFLGTSVAVSHGYPMQWLLLVEALTVIILIEVGKNGANEYSDYRSGADQFVAPADRTPFSGGKKVIIDNVLKLSEVGWSYRGLGELAVGFTFGPVPYRSKGF